MKLLLRIGALFCFLGLATSISAQTFPDRPFSWVVAFAPGSSTDTLTRLLAQKLSDRTRQPVVVANRVGAGGQIGARSVATAAPDGYTLLTHGPAIYGYTVFNKEPLLRMPGDLEPVGFLVDVPNVWLVPSALPLRSLKELMGHAKSNPGKLNWGDVGPGDTLIHFEIMKQVNGVDIQKIAYKGSAPTIDALIRNELQLIALPEFTAVPLVRDGRARAVAVSGAKRLVALAEVPTFAELGYVNFNPVSQGLYAPRGTPQPIISRLNTEIREILDLPDIREKLLSLGMLPHPSTPEELAARIRADVQTWADVARKAGIQPE